MKNEKLLVDVNVVISAIDEYMKNVYDCPLDEIVEYQRSCQSTKCIYIVQGLCEATEIFKDTPTVDAEELVHGRWEDEHGGAYVNPRFRCSVCKERALYRSERDFLGTWNNVQVLTPRCPFCGAVLDGGNEDG